MRRAVCFLLAASALLQAAPRKIQLADGTAEFEWLSASTFRLLRTWSAAAGNAEPEIQLESAHLAVQLVPQTMKCVVRRNGKVLAEFEGPRREPGKIVLAHPLAAGEQVYTTLGGSTKAPFLTSSAGFGLIVRGAERYLTDIKAQRLTVTSQGSEQVEYLFMYGPKLKEIFAERRLAERIPEALPTHRLELDKLDCAGIRRLNEKSIAGVLEYEFAGPEWIYFLGAYSRETHDRGLPTLRPLLIQFPNDPAQHGKRDVLMFGDEILVVPACATPFALPQGVWTDLKSGIEHRGRATITASEPVTLLARNGTIVPLLKNGIIELHYFPKLGAEFFIFEPEVNDYSQVHASQAGDFWRLEIESKVSRTFEWVLHHIGGPDGKEPRRIRVEAKAGVDHILNLPL